MPGPVDYFDCGENGKRAGAGLFAAALLAPPDEPPLSASDELSPPPS
jgi:hypothetical protein